MKRFALFQVFSNDSYYDKCSTSGSVICADCYLAGYVANAYNNTFFRDTKLDGTFNGYGVGGFV